MATLKVTFPHYDEDGNWFMAGDFREVPDDLVEFHLRPSIQLGVTCMAIDPEVWTPEGKHIQEVSTVADEPMAELGAPEDSDLLVVKAAEPEAEELAPDEDALAEDAPAEPRKKGKK